MDEVEITSWQDGLVRLPLAALVSELRFAGFLLPEEVESVEDFESALVAESKSGRVDLATYTGPCGPVWNFVASWYRDGDITNGASYSFEREAI